MVGTGVAATPCHHSMRARPLLAQGSRCYFHACLSPPLLAACSKSTERLLVRGELLLLPVLARPNEGTNVLHFGIKNCAYGHGLFSFDTSRGCGLIGESSDFSHVVNLAQASLTQSKPLQERSNEGR